MATPKTLDLTRGREQAVVADWTVAFKALAETRVIRRVGRDARVAGHAVEKILVRQRERPVGDTGSCARGGGVTLGNGAHKLETLDAGLK